MRVILTWDGDGIGRLIGRAREADDIEAVRRADQAISLGNRIWESWVTRNGGSIIEMGGDEGSAEIPADKLSELPKIRDQYAQAVGSTVSVGVGIKLSESDRALLAAKLQGKNRIVLYTPEVEEIVQKLQDKQGERSEAEKLGEAYLTKAQPAANTGPGAGFSGASKPGGPSIQKPSGEASEHSQGEAAATMMNEDNPPPPETTRTAQNLEDQFHDLAGEQQAKDSGQQAPTEDQTKLQIVQVLQALKAQAPILEQVKQSAPETYQAVMGLAQAVIIMARQMNGSPPGQTGAGEISDRAQSQAQLQIPQPPQEEEEAKKSEGADAESAAIKIRRKTPKAREPHGFEAAEWTHPNGHPRCRLCGDEEPVSGHCKGADHDGKLEKDSLSPVATLPQRHHLILPVGSHVDPGPSASKDVGKIKVNHVDTQGTKQGWVQARAGMVLSSDGHAVSARNPKGK